MKRRIRPLLLALLWIWAALVFTVVDLFRNVPEFDRVRPTARFYRALRFTGHEMTGTPYLEADEFGALASGRHRTVAAGSRDARVCALLDELGTVRALSKSGFLEGLRAKASNGTHAQTRIEALRCLAEGFGPKAREILLARARDPAETDAVRGKAARYLARTGEEARPALESLCGPGEPASVREGARRGLIDLRRQVAGE